MKKLITILLLTFVVNTFADQRTAIIDDIYDAIHKSDIDLFGKLINSADLTHFQFVSLLDATQERINITRNDLENFKFKATYSFTHFLRLRDYLTFAGLIGIGGTSLYYNKLANFFSEETRIKILFVALISCPLIWVSRYVEEWNLYQANYDNSVRMKQWLYRKLENQK